MKYKNFFLLIFLNSILSLPIELFSYSINNIIAKTAHWICSGGLTWLEAFKYVNLTSKKKVTEILGNQNYNPDGANFIISVLKKYIDYPWQNIEIKEIKPELRLYIQAPLICSDSIIYVNPDFYDPTSDFRSDFERESLILDVGWIISTKHIQKSALVLLALPFVTSYNLELLSDKIRNYAINQQNINPIFKNFLLNFSWLTNFCITKLIVNKYLSKTYFFIQRLRQENRIKNLLSQNTTTS